MNTDLSYEEAVGRLQQIILDLQNDELSMDELIAKATQAKKLVEYCRLKLRSTERQLNDLIEHTDE